MPLKDILKKKDKIRDDGNATPPFSPPLSPPAVPDFKIIRTDTLGEEVIQAPVEGSNRHPFEQQSQSQTPSNPSSLHRLSLFRRSSNASANNSDGSLSPRESSEKRLSHVLHLGHVSRSRASSRTSSNVPTDLPRIQDDQVDAQEREAQWEKRATILVQGSPSTPTTPQRLDGSMLGTSTPQSRSRSSSVGRVNDPQGDVNIQEAIRLHEAGDLARSTELFGQLADPNGANNALSQVLYGLALRHGWGCPPNLSAAVKYLSAAAANSASVESEALRAGMKKGGAAKGELVLAIFELANCFRHGWGIAKDPVAARQYYETAANLGDTDAMNEAAWCFLEGFGGKKDKYMAAKYYRLAEKSGSKTLGNSWIWKEKYDNPKSK